MLRSIRIDSATDETPKTLVMYTEGCGCCSDREKTTDPEKAREIVKSEIEEVSAYLKLLQDILNEWETNP